MSRYNEEEWNRLKNAEKERQKQKYQNKYIDNAYKNYDNGKERYGKKKKDMYVIKEHAIIISSNIGVTAT